ncbi:hypothetical protein BC332_34087 [Capsicum chinense]|nr:hypothetical protein BC332_34087 [Capsicum chinense]
MLNPTRLNDGLLESMLNPTRLNDGLLQSILNSSGMTRLDDGRGRSPNPTTIQTRLDDGAGSSSNPTPIQTRLEIFSIQTRCSLSVEYCGLQRTSEGLRRNRDCTYRPIDGVLSYIQPMLVVSDHGMTENGNHGGSTFEETDSLALFIGPADFGTGTPNKANQVAALYYMGMAGHFGLGNTNTLATIDVAGAFIGVLNHSTVLSGVLMFIITYASPMLYLLSMVMYNSVKDTSGFIISQDGNIDSLLKRTLGFPCLVPLGLNSILLIAYTIVLLLMRNHLFVWSVFSPKFLYVCATTVCVCLGVSIVSSTMFYTCLVLVYRKKLQSHTDIVS